MLTDNMLFFRHIVTNKTGYYPEHFRNHPHFEEVDPATDACVDCVVTLPELPEDEDVFILDDPDSYPKED